VQSDSHFGGFGIVPNIFRNWESYRPTLAPGHDLIDHTTKERGEVYQELRALGAYLFSSQFGKNHTIWNKTQTITRVIEIGKNLADDLETTLIDADTYGFDITLPETPKFHLSKDEKLHFKLIVQGIENVVESNSDYDDDYSLSSTFWKENSFAVIEWLKYGFANAKRRYKGEFYYSWDMRMKLNKYVQEKTSYLENFCDTNEELTLGYDVESGEISISTRYDYY
jgi:hypothetical protein